jgi:rubrerythrin
MRKTIVFPLIVLVTTFISAAASAAPSKTLDNLQTAYNGESNASAKYLAYAEKADSEGYKGIAALFRAASRAETVHAENHAVVIKKLNGQPAKKIELPPIKSTVENLKDSVKGESYERDTMYPDFIAQAKIEGNGAAVRTFNLAKTAEAEHANLYAKALEAPDTMKEAKNFYVCTVCGYTTTNLDFKKCVSCFNPKDKYVKVA